ncbi:Serine carboxypeptidase-like 19 [Triticum urartu]|uniref:Serine carboxypeptidase-like 19 n=1 Tax=Triticum urartu TaxID=4572 RepID=M7YQE7_TRIUA|nr:Serine carboxypeptidase-like 19 [Triticum urartu]
MAGEREVERRKRETGRGEPSPLGKYARKLNEKYLSFNLVYAIFESINEAQTTDLRNCLCGSRSMGYIVGNPATGERIDESSKVPFAHGFGIISDQLYETILGHCQGQDYKNPTNVLCAKALRTFHSQVYDQVLQLQLLSEVMSPHILLIKCVYSSAGPHAETDDSAGASRKILSEEAAGIKMGKRLEYPPVRPPLDCIDYAHYLSYFWANDERTRDALGIKDGTVNEWVRCQDGGVPYTRDILSSIKYHRNVTANGYRALVYSGDHDSVVPHLGTQAWVRSLGFPIVDEWRAWHLHGQSAGFTITYSNNMTFATVKGGGHTAPEYEPDRQHTRGLVPPFGHSWSSSSVVVSPTLPAHKMKRLWELYLYLGDFALEEDEEDVDSSWCPPRSFERRILGDRGMVLGLVASFRVVMI